MTTPKEYTTADLLTFEQDETVSGYRMEVARLGADDPRLTIEVATDQQAHDYTERIGEVKTAIDTLEDIRTRVVAPLNEQVRAVNLLVGAVREPLKEWLAKAKRAVNLFLEQKEVERARREREARRAAEEAARKEAAALERVEQAKTEGQRVKALAKVGAATAATTQAMARVQAEEQPVRGIKTSSGTTLSTREVWDFEVVDATQVPREWLAVNETAIRKAVAAGVRTIPGVNIFQRKAVSVR